MTIVKSSPSRLRLERVDRTYSGKICPQIDSDYVLQIRKRTEISEGLPSE